MVMTSDQIAAQAGAFQQQIMMQNQYSGMLSQNAGAAPAGEQMMGHVANRGMGVGSAVLGGGLSLMGMDPASLAMRAGMAGFAGGGVMGAAGAAAGAFLPAYAMWKAGEYAGGQIMEGMGQQQAINATLRQNYQFVGQTGRGFNMAEMGGIGSMMRGMTETRGPGGEFATMDELTRLAGNMGRMGLAQGVRSAREFADKFKEMVTTVKDIATTFSTSLEQAQQVMVGMRQSGIFNNQAQVARQIRDVAAAGGMATSEVTGMMTVGSQISRMIGGRGRAGAMGGMKAIGNIGAMMQAGTLTEEQLYNLTGEEGAEGRRSLATNMMQQDASFLQSARGRAFLMSLAGKDGTLDPRAVQAALTGNVGAGEMMAGARKNIAQQGAFSMLVNQGRLRGAALEAFAGNAQTAAMSGWLQQRGLDVNNMDDRTRLIMMRQFNINPEEVDFKMQQLKELPLAGVRQELAGMSEAQTRGAERIRASQGLAGVKKGFEGFKHKVGSALQEVGQDIYQEGSNFLERQINKMTDDYVQFIERDVGQAAKLSIGMGSDTFKAAALEKFGMGSYKRMQGMVKIGGTGAINLGWNEARMTEESAQGYRSRGYKMREASGWFGLTWSGEDARQAANDAARADALSRSYSGGAAGIQLDMESRKAINQVISSGAMDLGAERHMEKMFEFMQGKGSTAQMRALAEKYKGGTAQERAALVGELTKQAGRGALGEALTKTPGAEVLMWQAGGERTAQDLYERIGEYAYKEGTTTDTSSKQKRLSELIMAQQNRRAATRGMGTISRTDTFQPEIERLQREIKEAGVVRGGKEKAGYGKALMEERSGEWALALTGSNQDLISRTYNTIQAERDALVSRVTANGGSIEGLTGDDRGRLDLYNDMLGAVDAREATKDFSKPLTEEEREAFKAKHNGKSPEDYQGALGLLADRGDVRMGQALKATFEYQNKVGNEWLRNAREGGTIIGGGVGGQPFQLTKDAAIRMRRASTGASAKEAEAQYKAQQEGKGDKSMGEQYLESIMEENRLRAQVSVRPEDVAGNKQLMNQADQLRADREKMEQGWDKSTRERMKSALSGTAGGAEAYGAIAAQDDLWKRMQRRGIAKAGGATTAKDMAQLAATLGIQVDRKQLEGMGGDTTAMANLIASSGGLEGQGANILKAYQQSRALDPAVHAKGLQELQKAEEASKTARATKAAENDPQVQAIKSAFAAALKAGVMIQDGSKVGITGTVTTRQE